MSGGDDVAVPDVKAGPFDRKIRLSPLSARILRIQQDTDRRAFGLLNAARKSVVARVGHGMSRDKHACGCPYKSCSDHDGFHVLLPYFLHGRAILCTTPLIRGAMRPRRITT